RVALAAYSYFDELPEDTGRPMLPARPTRPIPPVWREPRPVPTATAVVEPTESAGAAELTPTPLPPVAAPTVVATAAPPTAVAATSTPAAAAATLKPSATPAPTTTPVPPATAT